MAKKKHDDHTNHEAWAIPYADLMTLLLAFFVVMYAISSRNETKYRSISEALNMAFGGASRPLSPLQSEDGPTRAPVPFKTGAPPPPSSQANRKPIDAARVRGHHSPAQRQQLSRIADDLERALDHLVAAKLIVVRRKEWSLEVEINSDILFATGSAALDTDARGILHKVAGVLDSASNPVRIEGYTDNRPIHTAQFPSNWELSAARAASVVHLLSDDAIAPDRLSMMGFGEYRPFAANTSEDGRNRNRRVVLVILAGDDEQESSAPGLMAHSSTPDTATRPPAPLDATRQRPLSDDPRHTDQMGGTP